MNAIGRYYELIHQCPCGSGMVASRYLNETKEPVRACDKCRHLLLTRLLETSLRERFGADVSGETIAAFLVSNGCRIVAEIGEASRGQSTDVVVARCPLRREKFALVPSEWAERVLTSGVTG
jgi:hypothetical protein